MTPPQRAGIRMLFWIGLVAFIISMMVGKRRAFHGLQEFGTVPDVGFYSVTSTASGPMRTSKLRGRPWIANFIFTRCGGPCPIMSTKMAALQRILPKDVRLVSFTVDPSHDTAHVLQGYARRFKADPSRWTFARASEKTLEKMMIKDFKLSDKLEMHSTKFVLIDQTNTIRAYYDHSDEAFFKTIQKDVETLLSQEAKQVPEKLDRKTKNHE